MMTHGTLLPHVAILMANSGGGHRSAARSLAEAFDGLARVTEVNLMDEHAPFPINRFSEGYGPFVNYAPWLYRLVYRFGAARQRVLFAERAVYPFVRRRVAAALARANPDIWISVHPLQTDVPLQILRAMGSRAPFLTVVTDPVTPPVAWFCPHVDLCVVATEQAEQAALANGMPRARVRVVGLPVRRAFGLAGARPKPAARAALGLAAERPLVLLSGGGAGIGPLTSMARAIAWELARDTQPAQMAIIAGRNELLQNQLRTQPWPLPVRVLGFVEEMADWLAAADIFITKAGPGSMAEAACAGVPMIITGYVPGQEEGNITWVQNYGAGVYESRPEQVARLVCDWLRPGAPAMPELIAGTRRMAHCDASDQIARAALAIYRHERVEAGGVGAA